MDIVVWGAGAIGGTVAAFVARSGLRVRVVDIALDHLSAIEQQGLAIEGPLASFVVHIETSSPDDIRGPLHSVLLAVKSQHTADACRQIRPLLGDDGVVVALQNGLNYLTIAPIVGLRRTLPVLVDFDADYLRPGAIAYLGTGDIAVGELDGFVTPRARRVAEWLATTGSPVALSSNIEGHIWSKLAFTAVVAATALTDDPMADCFASPELVRPFLRLVDEVLGVASAVGIEAEPFGSFDPSVLRHASEERATEVFAALARSAGRSVKTHSGIWRDIAIRHRPTEVPALFEPVLRLADSHGVSLPCVTRLVELVQELETGRRQRGRENLALLN